MIEKHCRQQAGSRVKKTRDRVNGPHTVNGKQLQKNYKLAVNKIGKNKHKKGLTSFNGLTKSS